MFFFPDDYEGGWTLGNEIIKDGIGLHTGTKCNVRIKPTEVPGFQFSFSEEADKVRKFRGLKDSEVRKAKEFRSSNVQEFRV